ncbi:NUDIX domain-containing protein [Caldovatus aquaticus]|uniref:NUDIX domain-containing protein n=1 Tax=Caldovatus aquaticus TaxID=2865671 RepID=A0ABS7F2V2_9PROT|nr:NUDIX domain-containing protein [Caldovatus aquaticus]MBW8269936.1 NUDIX domain-containing protein [Caldovatus aquaticus]
MPDDAPRHGAREPPAADNPGGADAEGTRPPRARPVRPRHAATLILWRATSRGPEVLMGRRHARLRFMPNLLVFPGGRVDRADHRAPAISELRPGTRRLLELRAPPSLARALAVAAVRELFEETGLALGARRGDGVAADLARLDYLCRAVTPADRPMRFNARFLIAPAEAAEGAIAGSGELEALRFYRLDELAAQPVATITRLVLAEFRAWLAMTPRQRARRPPIVFSGQDRRRPERTGRR